MTPLRLKGNTNRQGRKETEEEIFVIWAINRKRNGLEKIKRKLLKANAYLTRN